MPCTLETLPGSWMPGRGRDGRQYTGRSRRPAWVSGSRGLGGSALGRSVPAAAGETQDGDRQTRREDGRGEKRDLREREELLVRAERRLRHEQRHGEPRAGRE